MSTYRHLLRIALQSVPHMDIPDTPGFLRKEIDAIMAAAEWDSSIQMICDDLDAETKQPPGDTLVYAWDAVKIIAKGDAWRDFIVQESCPYCSRNPLTTCPMHQDSATTELLCGFCGRKYFAGWRGGKETLFEKMGSANNPLDG